MLYEKLLFAAGGRAKTQLYGFGRNSNYTLGLNSTTDLTVPTLILNNSNIKDITTARFSSGIIIGGDLYTCGFNGGGFYTGQGASGANIIGFTKIISPSFIDWTKVNTADYGGLALRGSGILYSWGSNANGQTGQNTTTGTTNIPTQVGLFTNWFMISGRSEHSVALRGANNIGTLWTFGSNTSGATGLGATTGSTNIPTQIGTATDWIWASAGSGFSMGIRNGVLWGWGGSTENQAGFMGTIATPQQIGTFTDWKKVSCGRGHSLGIRGTGSQGLLYSWGRNTNAVTGQNTTTGTSVVTQVGTFTDWIDCVAGNDTSYGLRADGSLYSWGTNLNYATGLNTATGTTLVPTKVGNLKWTKLSTVNLVADNTVPGRLLGLVNI